MRIIHLILLSGVLALSFNAPTKTYKWMYQGNYVLGDVLSDLCDRTGCNLGLSGEVVELPITLSVKTSSPSVLLMSLRNALISSGYYLSGSLNGSLSVTRDAFSESAALWTIMDKSR